MLNFLTVLIAIVSFALVGIVLIQNPKGGGVDATMGSGVNNMLGAARSTDAVEKFTWYLAAALFALCLISYFLINQGGAVPTIQAQG
ncbi:MAG: hypothetical protein RL757_2 [Bacteroidota bacterium]|jgi:preprotein translocase subunit SecG